ncbi:hypothetical protein Q1695_015904 [Nippostrongylus brasiliensis]|nr:hypothetical protein Q1695_015904 [Nippostrongylus brasiliensis]
MGDVKYFVLFFIATLFRASSSHVGKCTPRTEFQLPFINDVFGSYGMTLDCDCVERAEGIASAKAHGGITDDYSGIYHIVTTTAKGTPLRHPQEQVKCMLDELFKEQNSLLTRIIGWTKGKHYGCSYARYPISGDEGNVSLALTCIFFKLDGRCQV